MLKRTILSLLIISFFTAFLSPVLYAGTPPQVCIDENRARKQEFLKTLEGMSKEEKQQAMERAQKDLYAKFEACLKANANEVQEKVQERVEEKTQLMQEKRENLIEKKEETVARVCEKTETRIAEKISSYEENRDYHMEQYDTLMNQLYDIADSMDFLGLETADFRTSISELNVKVLEYIALYDDLISQLKLSQEYACGESEGSFKEAVQQAIVIHKELVSKRQEIREFYSTDVRSAIKDLREQAKNLRDNNL